MTCKAICYACSTTDAHHLSVELCAKHALTDLLAEGLRVYFEAASHLGSHSLDEYAAAQKALAEYDSAKNQEKRS